MNNEKINTKKQKLLDKLKAIEEEERQAKQKARNEQKKDERVCNRLFGKSIKEIKQIIDIVTIFSQNTNKSLDDLYQHYLQKEKEQNLAESEPSAPEVLTESTESVDDQQ